MKVLDIELFSGPLRGARVDTWVVPVPLNERPLRAAAGELDWRMAGAISSALRGGSLTGTFQDAVLLPAAPPLSARRVLLVGTGAIEALPGRGVQDTFRNIAARLLGLRSERSMVALPAAIDLAGDAERALRGCLQVISAHRGDVSLCLGLPERPGLAEALLRASSHLADEALQRNVRLGVERVSASVH